MRRRGFTLIELLVFVALFSVVIVGIITVFITAVDVQSRQSSSNDVETQGQFLLQSIQYYVQSARLVDMTQDVATSTLTLREVAASSTLDPTIVSLSNGTVYLQQGIFGSLQPLTSNKVTASNLNFTRHYNLNGSSSAFGRDSVSFSFTLTSNTSSTSRLYTQSFQSSAVVLSPIPKIALIQQTSTAIAGGGVTSIALKYGTNNETSSLLIAVIGQTTSTASVSVSDTAGNHWGLIASTSYAAYNQKITIFEATSSLNSSNTVTASFGASVGSPSLFLYEYRGASTSTSFDASSSQIQTSTAAPVSPSASPTSTVELLFSAMYCNPSTGPVNAGPGFVIETSSTLSSMFVEDQDVFVTGSVNSTWAYAGNSPSTTSSSVILVTFH